MTTASIAANAYQSAAKLGNEFTKNAATTKLGGAGDMDFGALVKDAVGELVDKGRASDAMSVDMMQGKANVVDVVTAVAETELALETMVSVRDKVIAAYEEIMRMPI